MKNTAWWIFGYGVLQALLYVSLLPLWEGFDEPYHYGYVTELAWRGTWPVSGKSGVDSGIWLSMRLAPASYLNQRNTPELTSFGEYFLLPEAERTGRRARLEAILGGQGASEAVGGNHEAQQPPLGYLPLALLERLQGGAPLMQRVWLLRLASAIAALGLLAWAVVRLADGMGLSRPYASAALLLLMSTQGLYAAVAHVANDWLAVPLVAVLFVAGDRFVRAPGRASAATLALALAAGLLSKAYFLVFVPPAVALVLWKARRQVVVFGVLLTAVAGPWYTRNMLLYGTLLGLQPAVASIPQGTVAEAFLSLNWPAAIPGLARAVLWNGNASFTTYSAGTFDVMIGLLLAGVLLLARARGEPVTGVLVLSGSAVFSLVPVYAMVLVGAPLGAVFPGSVSWYGAGLLAGVYLLACAGFAAGGRAGQWLLRACLALSAVVVAGTYFAKLIPMYAGFHGPARPAVLAALYGHQFGDLIARLDQCTMAPAWLVIALAVATVTAGAILTWRVGGQLRPLVTSAPGPGDRS